ncbi:MAG: VCBS repeat-containing protein [Alkalinema sp. RU_4_3]|nr:VCBS repeat-containing protein [Alkalinema sp. RU_4_3]
MAMGGLSIVGFGQTAVAVALGQANGSFGTPFNAITGFTPGAGQWNSFDRFPRQLADVNGDGRADIVGFGESGVVVALAQTNGTFGNPFSAFTGFTTGSGRWLTYNQFPRQMGDINGDGRADIVGFGEHGVFVALGQLDGTFIAPHQYNTLNAFTVGAGRWTNFDQFPRQVVDLNKDGLADVVGFGESGVYVALNQTPQFSRNIDLLFELDFKTSGQSIWGNSQAKYKYDRDYSVSWNEGGSVDVGFGSIGGYTNGAFGVKYGYDVDFGSINANLPVQTWFDLPDQIQAGQTITLKSGYNLKETANFSTTAPRISAYFDFLAKLAVGGSLTLDALGFDKTWQFSPVNFDQSFSLKFDTANSWSTGFGGQELNVENEKFSANFSEGKLIELEVGGIKSGTTGRVKDDKTIVGSSDSTLLKANLDLDNLLARIVGKIPKLKPVGEALKKLEGKVGGSVDLGVTTAYGGATWNLFDAEFSNRLGLKTNLNLFADNLAGTLYLEDGRQQNFTVGQDLTFNVGADVNGDGFINMSATVALTASFENKTALAYQGALEMEALSASGKIGAGELSAGGSIGPVWSYAKDIPGLNAETSLYDRKFGLTGLNSQSFNFAVAVGNRA